MNWFALSLTLFSQILITYRNKWGMVVSLIGNILWILILDDPAVKVLNVVFIALNVKGFFEWRKKETKERLIFDAQEL